jgi:hypothetical protein
MVLAAAVALHTERRNAPLADPASAALRIAAQHGLAGGYRFSPAQTL